MITMVYYIQVEFINFINRTFVTGSIILRMNLLVSFLASSFVKRCLGSPMGYDGL